MDTNLTNKEEAELLKKWWRDYGRAILIAVVIGLLIGYGWRFWQSHKTAEAVAASSLYQQALVANQQDQPLDKQQSLRDALLKQQPHSPYAALVQLLVAGAEVNADQSSAAIKDYQWVLENSKVSAYQQIARLRLAKLQLQDKKYSQALQTLTVVNDATYQPIITAMQGEVYQAQGHIQKAQAAYQSAIAAMKKLGVDTTLLSLRAASLPLKTTAAAKPKAGQSVPSPSKKKTEKS